MKYALGSGTRGISYLIEHDGRLFQSPISWYGQKKQWDLSPGYDVNNLHFDRPIEPDCLFCHANRVEPIRAFGQPVRAANLPRPRDRLRAVPRAGESTRRRSWSMAGT